jgi:hypothetical protein
MHNVVVHRQRSAVYIETGEADIYAFAHRYGMPPAGYT